MPTSTDDLLRHNFTGAGGDTLDARVRELIDREEIRELAARYALRIARRESVADLFTDDGVFISRGPGPEVQEFRGRAQLDKVYGAYVGGHRLNMPMAHNHVISISGDEAVGVCWIELRATDKDGPLAPRGGIYEDRLRREHGRWRYTLRQATMAIVGRPTQDR